MKTQISKIKFISFPFLQFDMSRQCQCLMNYSQKVEIITTTPKVPDSLTPMNIFKHLLLRKL